MSVNRMREVEPDQHGTSSVDRDPPSLAAALTYDLGLLDWQHLALVFAALSR
jgi:hypothetical protein